jgi:transcription initiation factor TFIIE subunit alpha
MKKLTNDEMNILALSYRLTGVEGYCVMKYIAEHREATDDDLSGAFKVKPNVIRQIIYNLERNHLISFRKEIDLKTNWVTFYYQINKFFFNNHTQYKKDKIIEKVRKRYEFEKDHTFFSCPNKCERIVFDQADEQNYRCSRCGEVLFTEDNGQLVAFLEGVLSRIIPSHATRTQDHRKAVRRSQSHK